MILKYCEDYRGGTFDDYSALIYSSDGKFTVIEMWTNGRKWARAYFGLPVSGVLQNLNDSTKHLYKCCFFKWLLNKIPDKGI
jgi:hypothetical protein